MTTHTRLRLGAVGLVLLAVVLIGGSHLCGVALDQDASDPGMRPIGAGPLACTEFWLNRYQTLIGAIVAIIAARVAWIAVQQQVAIARAQLDAAIGNVDPQFVLEKAPRYDRFILWVHNLSSVALVIDRIKILTPETMICEVEYRREPGMLRNIGSQNSEDTIDFNLRVPGTAPSAADVSQVEMYLTTTLSGWIPVADDNRTPSVARFEIYYRKMNPDQSRHRIEVACAYIPDDGENV